MLNLKSDIISAKRLIIALSIGSLFLGGCTTSFKTMADSLTTDMASIKDYPKNETLEIPEVMGLSDITTIALEWRVEFTGDVDGYRIYRAKYNSTKPEFKLVRQINDRYVKHYVNTHLNPNSTYLYAMSTIKDGKESLLSPPLKFKTKPMPRPTEDIVAYSGMANSVKLVWRPSKDTRVTGYLLEKYDPTYRKWEKLKKIEDRLSPEYIDTGLEDGVKYKYRLRSIIDNRNIYGEPTKVVEAQTKTRPPVIENINIISKPHSVQLTWDVADVADYDYYSVYRVEDWQYVNNVVLYKKLLGKTKETTFTDKLPGKNGEDYYYMVTVTDVDGLESKGQRPAKLGYTLRKPKTPIISKSEYIDGDYRISVFWNGERTKKFKVIKTTKKQWFMFDTETKIIDGTAFVDKNIDTRYSYEYSFIAIDKHGIESEPSKPFGFSPREQK